MTAICKGADAVPAMAPLVERTSSWGVSRVRGMLSRHAAVSGLRLCKPFDANGLERITHKPRGTR
jgi:hypothetical protein